jgi:hypothetical protein
MGKHFHLGRRFAMYRGSRSGQRAGPTTARAARALFFWARLGAPWRHGVLSPLDPAVRRGAPSGARTMPDSQRDEVGTPAPSPRRNEGHPEALHCAPDASDSRRRQRMRLRTSSRPRASSATRGRRSRRGAAAPSARAYVGPCIQTQLAMKLGGALREIGARLVAPSASASSARRSEAFEVLRNAGEDPTAGCSPGYVPS